jgi:hypothetical protein
MWVKLSNNIVASYSFPTIDPKLGVELPNFIESNKSTLEQEVEGFHMACGGGGRNAK